MLVEAMKKEDWSTFLTHLEVKLLDVRDPSNVCSSPKGLASRRKYDSHFPALSHKKQGLSEHGFVQIDPASFC